MLASGSSHAKLFLISGMNKPSPTAILRGAERGSPRIRAITSAFGPTGYREAAAVQAAAGSGKLPQAEAAAGSVLVFGFHAISTAGGWNIITRVTLRDHAVPSVAPDVVIQPHTTTTRGDDQLTRQR